jgi:hypothetical protein
LTATTAAGDINIEAIGDTRIPVLSALLGSTNLSVGGSLAIDALSGANITLKSPGAIDIGTLTATVSANLAANTIHAGIVQPAGALAPLALNFTGLNGTIAKSVVVTIDAPNGSTIAQLFATDAAVTANSDRVAIQKGFVPGPLELGTLTQDILLNNRSPAPVIGPTMQLYGPDKLFSLIQNGNIIITTDHIVAYDVTAAVTALSAFEGMSFVRDIPREMHNGAPVTVDEIKKDGKTFYVIGLSPSAMLEAAAIPKSVESIGTGPAVNTDGLQ